MRSTGRRSAVAVALLGAAALAGMTASAAAASPAARAASSRTHPHATASSATFATGQLNLGSGCGSNPDGEPQIHVSQTNALFLGSERGLGGGSDGWRQAPTAAGASASACSLTYAGQPNAINGNGLSGGDLDLAWGSAPLANGNDPLYVSSLNLGSVAVAHSSDNGATFTNVPVQAGLPVDDREWIAAFGSSSSLLSFHDIATTNIDILRSDNQGQLYVEIAQAIPPTDYKANNNQLGNLVIDHRNTAGTAANLLGSTPFWAYQSFVAPSSNPGPLGGNNNEAFLAVSNDGGFTWTDRAVPCSVSSQGLDHQFPNVSVAPDGTLWMAWSDDTNVVTATSTDHGRSWSCSTPVSTTTAQAVMPWLVATSGGVELVYYGSPTAPGKGTQTWYVYFAQDLASTISGWTAPQQLVGVHTGAICESGVTCTSGRQLLDDFGIDTDRSGLAHIAYSHDSPDLGGAGTYTGYAVQTGGTAAGVPN